MSKHRYVGGIISATQPTPSQSSASGVWTLDEAQYYQQSGQWPPGGGNDPYFQNTTLLLHGDGTNGAQNNTFVDSSANNFTITRTGNTTQGSFNPYVGPGNWSVFHPTTQTGWQTPANSASTIIGSAFNSTVTFTAEAWIYPLSRHSGGGAVLGYVVGQMQTTGASVDWSFGPDSNGNLALFWYNAGNQISKGTSIIPLNTWTHIALSVSNGTIRMFVNGVQETLTGLTTTSSSSTAVSYISSGGYVYAGTTWQGFNGYISNLRVVGKRAVYTAGFTPSTTPLIATTDTTLLVNNQNGFRDMSGAGWALTTTNAPQVSKFSPFTFYQTNPASYSGYFDGTGDYLSMAASPSTALGSGDFTVEYWAFYNTFASSPIGFDSRSSSGDITPSDYVTTGGNLVFYYNSANLLTSTNAAVLGRWNHIAWVRAGNVLTSYINGVASGSVLSGTNFGNSQPFRVAGNITAANFLNGSISNFRVVKGTAIYTANFTPSTAALTTTTTVSANQSNSVSFDGNGDYLTLPTGTSLQLNTQDFTIEAWVYPTARVTNSAYIISQSSYGVGTDFVFWITSTGILQFYMLSGGANNIVTSTGTVPLNAWTHVAIVRSGSLFRLYINGVNDGSLTGSQNITNTYTPATIANSTNNTGSVYFPGQISNLRVTRGVAVYTTNFTPATSALTATTTVSSSSTNSVSFDGSGDYLSVPSNAAFGFGTGDFTVEYWVYATSWASTPTIVDLRAAAGVSGFSDYYSAGGAPNMYWHNTTVLTSSLTVPVNTWTHVAYTRQSGAIKIFVNGALGASGASTSDLQASVPCRIGATFSPNNFLTGFVSNLRITKGQALYTAAFTPSTTPLTTTSQGATAANVSLLTCQDRLLEDNSLNYFPVTAAGVARPTSLNPFVSTNGIGGTSYSGLFNGSTDYLSLTNSNFTTLGDFTIEGWAYVNSAQSGSYAGIFSTRDSANSNGLSINILNTGFFDFGVFPGGSYTSKAVPFNQWFHVAMVRSGTGANNVKCFLNGVEVGSFTSTSSTSTLSGAAVIGRYYASGTNQYFLNGFVSNLRYVVGTALYSSNFSPSTTPLTAVVGTQLLTCQSTTFIDASGNSGTITANWSARTDEYNPFSGATTLLTAQSRLVQDNSAIPMVITANGDAKPTSMNPFVSTNGIGGTSYSGYFSGTNYLTLGSQTAFAFGTGDFTIEAWVYPLTVGATAQTIYDTMTQGDATGTGRIGFDFNTSLRFFTGAGTILISGGTMVAQTWQHVAVCRVSGLTRLFLNGVQVGSTYTDTNSYVIGTANRPIIGVNAYNASSNAFSGYISNLRSIKGQGLYTSAFSPSTTPLTTTSQGATAANVSLLTCQNTTFIDNSTNAFFITNTGTTLTDEFNPFSGATTLLTCQSTQFIDNSAIPLTITANGNATPKRANPFTDTVTGPAAYATTTYGGSAYFDGGGDYLTLTGSANLAFGSNNFTIEAWVYPITAADRMIYDGRPSGGTGAYPTLYLGANNQVYYYTAGANRIFGGTIQYYAWNHIALVRSSGTTRLYLNGALVGSYVDANVYLNGAARPIIGIDGNNLSTLNMLGYLSNLRVVNGTAVYTTPFVPPAAPVTAVSGTQLLVNGTNAGIFDNTTVNDLETVGSAQVSTSVVKYGTGSMYFNGLSSYLQSPASSLTVAFSTGDFTVELWVNFAANNATYNPFIRADNAGFDFGYDFSTSQIKYRNIIVTSWTPTIGTWYHVALTRASGSSRLFVDGTQLGSTATGDTQNYVASAFRVGGSSFSSSHVLNGYIDDVRVTQGYARYTANFTPPPAAFPNF